eukprot:g603.t1
MEDDEKCATKTMSRTEETQSDIAPHFGDIGGLKSFSPLPEEEFEPMERIVLLANGNLQRIISAYYNANVSVIIRKNERVAIGTYDREVDLVCYDRVFCRAKSKVVVTNKAMLAAINSNQVGIGQLFRYFRVLPVFDLLEANKNESGAISRKYVLQSEGVRCEIHEEFVSNLFSLRDTDGLRQ